MRRRLASRSASPQTSIHSTHDGFGRVDGRYASIARSSRSCGRWRLGQARSDTVATSTLGRLPEHRLDQLVLGGEVVVDQAAADVELVGDVDDPQVVQPPLERDAVRRGEDLPAALSVRAGDARCGVRDSRPPTASVSTGLDRVCAWTSTAGRPPRGSPTLAVASSTTSAEAPLGRTPTAATCAASRDHARRSRHRHRAARRRGPPAEQRRPRRRPLPRVHPGRPGDDGGAVRRRRRGVVVRRRELAGGRRRGRRRERRARLAARLAGLPPPPAAASWRAARPATSARSPSLAHVATRPPDGRAAGGRRAPRRPTRRARATHGPTQVVDVLDADRTMNHHECLRCPNIAPPSCRAVSPSTDRRESPAARPACGSRRGRASRRPPVRRCRSTAGAPELAVACSPAMACLARVLAPVRCPTDRSVRRARPTGPMHGSVTVPIGTLP